MSTERSDWLMVQDYYASLKNSSASPQVTALRDRRYRRLRRQIVKWAWWHQTGPK